MYKVSIIVPVYNAEKYIRRTLDSLLNQTLDDLEIVVINDGSKDSSLDICNEYKDKYENIHIYSKENGGLSSARNMGIKMAQSDYLAFVDSDDYIDVEMMETLYRRLIQDKSDLAICGLSVDYENENLATICKNDCSPIKDECVENGQLCSKAMELKQNGIIDSCCNKMFKKNLIKKHELQMPYGELFEDTEFMFHYLRYVNRISLVNRPYYHYMQRSGQRLTNTYNPKKWYFLRKRIFTMYDFLNSKGTDEPSINSELQYWLARYYYSTMMDLEALKDNRKQEELFHDFLKDKDLKKIASLEVHHSSIFRMVYINSLLYGHKWLVQLITKLSYKLKMKRNSASMKEA